MAEEEESDLVDRETTTHSIDFGKADRVKRVIGPISAKNVGVERESESERGRGRA